MPLLCVVYVGAYTNSLLHLFYLLQSTGGVGEHLCPLAMPVTVVQWWICQWEAKARERSEGAKRSSGGVVLKGGGGEIFEKFCIKHTFSCTINAIIRGSLCTGIDQFPILLFFLFPFFLTRRSTGGGGGMAPLCPLSYASGQWFRIFKNLCVSNTNLGLNPLVFDVDFKLILIIILVALTCLPFPRIIAQSDS